MRATPILRELEKMTHSARMRRMVELGRQARTDARIVTLLDELAAGDFYSRSLAVQSCYGSGDGKRALLALDDPSAGIRTHAIGLVALVCDDDEVRAALAKIPREQRPGMIKALWRRRRRGLVDELLEVLAAHHDADLAALIRWGSVDLVRRRLPQVVDVMTAGDWRALAHVHPQVVAEALRLQALQAEQLDHRLLQHANAALPELAEEAPDEAVMLVRALLRHASPAQLSLQRLVERRPAVMADLLSMVDNDRVSFTRIAYRLDIDRLRQLIARRTEMLRDPALWLGRLRPEQRAAVADMVLATSQDRDGCIPRPWLTHLPRVTREAEGRRHLKLPALITRPEQRLPYAALLPWDEARSVLDQFMRSPDVTERAVALAALAFAARFHRTRVADLLNLFQAHGREQDPVRYVMLEGLAELPPSTWQNEHLDTLGVILRQALDAADLSAGTAAAAERLIVALLPRHPAWSTPWLATLVRERGAVYLRGLEQRLTDYDVRRMAPSLLPVLQAWNDRERERHILAVAQRLGRRLRVFDGLADLLERVLRATREPFTADQALALLVEHRPERAAMLIPALLREDPSWITRPVVYTYLHRHRQDLLTPFLGQQSYRGRFHTGKTVFVLPLSEGFHRWTSSQQATFATTLSQVVGDEVRDTPAILRSIHQLAALPAVPPTRLVMLANDRRPAVGEAALRALGQRDAGDGVPALLDALKDERAHIAIYALRRALLQMPGARAFELLRSAPSERVTVAKEIVRLLGELDLEEAYRYLLGLDQQDLQRDVRIALLRAFWNHLEHDESWAIFERAAVDSDPAIARSVISIPADRLGRAAQQRLVALLVMLLRHADPRVRLDVLRRCADLPVADPNRRLHEPLLNALASALPDEQAAVAAAVFSTYTGRDASLVGAAIARVRTNRRALWVTLQALTQALYWNRVQLLPTVRAVLQTLGGDAHTAALRVVLAVGALPWPELAELMVRMATGGELHAQALCSAGTAIEQATRRSDATGLGELEAALAASEDPALRHLALSALITQATLPPGWTGERIERLHGYRADPAPLVAATAQFTFPPGEVD